MPETGYELIRSKRKTISVSITDDARVVVRAPLRAPRALIEGFLSQKRRWIAEKQCLAAQRAAAHPQGGFLNGEEFPYLGRKLMLAVSDRATRIEAVGGVLAFPKAWLPLAQDRLRLWYRSEAEAVLGARLSAISERTGLRPASVGVTDARHRWGSCGANGSINFTWRLVTAPPEVIDYVIAHELAHIRHLNHSREFWGCVGSIMPDYMDKKKWLRENNALLRLL